MSCPPRKDEGGWRLYGTTWFTSAITSDMALTLGRPDGNPPGGRGLALFYVELHDTEGKLRTILINRLKDELGTRKVPTAELTLDGTPATALVGLPDGIRNITSTRNVTRTWNALGSAGGRRRALALARDYTGLRVRLGAPLSEKPLHVDTLAGMAAEQEIGSLSAFRAAELLGRRESGDASEHDTLLLRVVTPIVKLTTGKQAAAIASEALEACGGAGFVGDTGLPRLLRDAQVLPIWEGTTNVLSPDTLRALAGGGAFFAVEAEGERLLSQAGAAELAVPVQVARDGFAHAKAWLSGSLGDPPGLEAGARRFALTAGRSLGLALLARHARGCLEHGHGAGAAAAARRFARHGVDLIGDFDASDSRLLAQ